MANIFFISLGCDKNRIDSEIMLKKLSDGGHSIVGEIEQADCAVVNTCGFDNATIGCQVAIQNSQPPVLRIGVRLVADTATFTVKIKAVVVTILAECHLRWYTAR